MVKVKNDVKLPDRSDVHSYNTIPALVMTIKGLGLSSRVSATGHVKDPVPLTENSRALCPSGRFPPSFIHQVIIIMY